MQGAPRKKEPIELEWSKIKRGITAQVNFEAQVWRERRLNDLLAQAWKDFQEAFDKGRLQIAEMDVKALPGGPSFDA